MALCCFCNEEIEGEEDSEREGFWAVTVGAEVARAYPVHLQCLRQFEREQIGVELEEKAFESLEGDLESRRTKK